MINYLVKSQHRALKDRFAYSISAYKPKSKPETMDYNIQVIEVPAGLGLDDAVKFVNRGDTINGA